MARRDFDAAANEMLGKRPVFTLGGMEWKCRPGLKFDAISGISDQEGLAFLRSFFNQVIIKSQRAAFNELLDEDEDDDDAIPITGEQLRDVFNWLVEEYSGKSLAPASGSSATPEPTGQPSKVVSLSQVGGTPLAASG